MFFSSKEDRLLRQGAQRSYRALVAAAREPYLYQELGVADTLDGRFEMIVLHIIVLEAALDRKGDDRTIQRFRRALEETFFHDMDRSLREVGVGDLSVGKQIKFMASAFKARSISLSPLFATDDVEELAATISKGLVLADGANSEEAGQRLAQRAMAALTRLDDQSEDSLLSGAAAEGVVFGQGEAA